MAIIKDILKAEIKEAYAQVMDDDGDRDVALDKVAGALADAIMNAVKSITISYTTGLIAPPMGGVVTGTFTCEIS